jgi:hypothetical protein
MNMSLKPFAGSIFGTALAFRAEVLATLEKLVEKERGAQ